MKAMFAQLSMVLLFAACICHADDPNKNNPGLALNPQDVPVFYDNNPLSGLQSFTVITSFALEDNQLQKIAKRSIERTLEKDGEVIHLKDNDMRGFGAGNILLIQMDQVMGWDGSKTSMSRLSLTVETPVTLDKTGLKTFPMVWSTNVFLPEPMNSISQSSIEKTLEILVGQFIRNYQYSNPSRTNRPVFYQYD